MNEAETRAEHIDPALLTALCKRKLAALDELKELPLDQPLSANL
jgi:hypothetical protein